MSQPISIGDVYLLSKLAWRIGRALGPGQKAATSEIGEVQNQLFALGTALDLSRDAYTQHEVLGDSQSFQMMLSNCRESLRHLEKLMEKYDVDSVSSPDDPPPLRLKESVIRNWTKIKWTTKGGDVSDLRDALGAHISAINLALSALHVERGREIEIRTGRILQMAEEVYQSWKNGKPSPGSEPQQATRPSGALARSTIYNRTDMSKEPKMICPRALIRLKCAEESSIEGTRLFECACEENRQPHAEDLALTLQDASFLVRTPNQRPAWEIQLYSENLGRSVQAVISNVAPSALGEFEAFIHALALRQGKNMLRQGMNSLLAFTERDTSGEESDSSLSVLKMQAQATGIQNSIEDVTFYTSGNGPQLTLRDIQSVRLLHYFSFPLDGTCESGKDKQYAELSFTASSIAHFTIQVCYSTEIDLNTIQNNVFLDEVLCVEEGQTSSQLQATVRLHFESTDAAEEFENSLRLMQVELLVSYLRAQRVRESILFTKSMGDCKVREFLLLDATATGIRDDVTGEERVIVTNNSKALSVCVSSPSNPAQLDSDLFLESPLVVVQISADRTSIIPLDIDSTFTQVGSSDGLGVGELH